MTPGSAPSPPPPTSPRCSTTFPSSYSFVSSPMYHTLPSTSWAYQSKVSSWTSPATSRCPARRRSHAQDLLRLPRHVDRHDLPLAVRLPLVDRGPSPARAGSTGCPPPTRSSPGRSSSRTDRRSGGISIARDGRQTAWPRPTRMSRLAAGPGDDSPQAARTTRDIASVASDAAVRAAGRSGARSAQSSSAVPPLVLGGAVVVDASPITLKFGVERHLHDATVIETDLHAVGGAVVPRLRLDDRAAARVRERRGGRLVERRAGERLIVVARRWRSRSPSFHPATARASAPPAIHFRFRSIVLLLSWMV